MAVGGASGLKRPQQNEHMVSPTPQPPCLKEKEYDDSELVNPLVGMLGAVQRV